MADDSATKKLRALIERPEECTFWGSNYTVTPRLIARAFGDGQRLLCIQPLATRPNYFVVRVDSNTKHPSDSFEGGGQVSLLEEIMCAAEEEYGYHGDEEERDENGDERRPFPVVDWGVGCTWGKPFPVSEWKPTPRKRAARAKGNG